jgi:hypothetical protein
MGFIKKSDVDNHVFASENKSRYSSGPAAQADRANSFETEPDGARARRPTFFEDFTLEHSLPGRHITSIEISGCF